MCGHLQIQSHLFLALIDISLVPIADLLVCLFVH